VKFAGAFVAMAALLAGSVPALAGGPVTVAPEPALALAPLPVVPTGGDWTGFSAGLSLGLGDVSAAGGTGSGPVYGLSGAYDYDFGKFVLGGTASYDWSNIATGADTLQGMGRLGLRGGLDLGKTFVFATGGAARAMQGTGGGTATGNGWFAGIGAERKLSGNLALEGQLLTSQFADFNGSGSDLKATTLSLGVSFGF
jgi:outer membrane immunogenic protein